MTAEIVESALPLPMRMKSGTLMIAILLFASVACSRESSRPATYPDAPVIIISVDTLRSDRLPAYGYGGVETPNIDALRADGILFTSAYSHVPLTLPSHVSMLTGLLPAEANVRNNIGYRFDGSKHATLPAILKKRGYATGAAISAYVLRSSTGISDGFDFYDDAIASRTGAATGTLQRSGDLTAEVANRWITSNASRPFFFMFHIFEPHSPYEAPEPFRSRYAGEPYDGEIAASDAIVGRFIEQLKRDGVYDKAVIFFLSDHGEGLHDHGEPEHGIFIYREAIQVPLIVKLPGADRRGETIQTPVGLIDLVPTIAELLGIDAPPGIRGRSLMAEPTEEKRRIYAESLYGRIHLGWSELRGLIDDEYYFIEAPKPELYSVKDDPAQKNNVLASERRVYASMRDELARYTAAAEAPLNIDPEEAAKLSALGYLGSVSPAGSGPLPDPKDRIHEIDAMVAAMRLINGGEEEKGVAALREIVAKNPGLADAWNQLGVTLENMGRLEDSAAAYRKAIEQTPSLAGEFALALGSVLLKLEDFDGAEAHARLAESSNPSGTNLLLSRTALARGDLSGAERRARSAMEDSYERRRATIVLAQVLVKQGRLQDAMSMLDEVAREAEQNQLGPVEMLEFTRGDALARMDRPEESIAAFLREIEHFPRHRQAYANLVLVYLLTGNRAEAEATFERMVRANPEKRSYLFAATTLDELDEPQLAASWRRRAASAE